MSEQLILGVGIGASVVGVGYFIYVKLLKKQLRKRILRGD
tara:strand:+ start:71 stop:190 length:120 start_codon:yes stop_codon:yes gene_type:complete